ncbi:MAG: outer membrane beta-barrel protein, partial [Bacteroidales bacterium]|nr:outer membrane beta-barrel protein [Bacteroidales bacterium]
MKRLVLCLFAAASMLFATENVNAQKVNFGLKGGLNLSNWSTNDSEMKIGFHAGGYAQIKFNKMFAVQPEVLYSMEGTKTFNETTTTILGKEYYARY